MSSHGSALIDFFQWVAAAATVVAATAVDHRRSRIVSMMMQSTPLAHQLHYRFR